MGFRTDDDGRAVWPAAAIMHRHCSIGPGDFAEVIVIEFPAARPDTARFTCSVSDIWPS